MWYIGTFYYLSTFFINLNLFYNEITVQKNFSSLDIKSGKSKPVRRKCIYLLIISSFVHLFVYSLIIVNCSTNILSCLLCGSTVLSCNDTSALQWASSDWHSPREEVAYYIG